MIELISISISPSDSAIAIPIMQTELPKAFTTEEEVEKFRKDLIEEFKIKKGWENPKPYFNYNEIEI